MEEHYLNGRLKPITAYLGVDHTHILMTKHDEEDEAKSNAKVQKNYSKYYCISVTHLIPFTQLCGLCSSGKKWKKLAQQI